MRIRGILLGTALFGLSLATAQVGGGEKVSVIPLHPLAQGAEVIHGDIEKPGEPFVMRIRELRGGIIPLHQHPVDENITVLQGTLYVGTGDTFDRRKLQRLGPGGYAFLPKGTMIFGETPDGPAIVQVHGVGPFHLLWKYPAKTFESPDAGQVFRYRAGQTIRTKYGVGKIEKGWASGPFVQHETRVGKEVVMATEAEVRPAK